MRFLVAVVCILGASASASDLRLWGEAGVWEILIDPSTGSGCLAQRSFEGGTLVQIGSEPLRGGGFFAAYNAQWSDIQEGTVGIVNFDFGDAHFAGEAVGKFSEDLPGGYAFFDNPNFVTEFAKRQSVKVSGESGKLVEIDLSGTQRAIEAVLSCQKEQPEPTSN